MTYIVTSRGRRRLFVIFFHSRWHDDKYDECGTDTDSWKSRSEACVGSSLSIVSALGYTHHSMHHPKHSCCYAAILLVVAEVGHSPLGAGRHRRAPRSLIDPSSCQLVPARKVYIQMGWTERKIVSRATSWPKVNVCGIASSLSSPRIYCTSSHCQIP